MRKLLFSSSLLILAACGTSEDSIDTTSSEETKTVDNAFDSLNVIMEDTVRAIEHGSPDQEKLDSIKNAKKEEKNKSY